MLKKTRGGSRPFCLAGGAGQQSYLEDGDTVSMRGVARGMDSDRVWEVP